MKCPVCNQNEVVPGELCDDCTAPEGVAEILRELVTSYFASPLPHNVSAEAQELGRSLAILIAAAEINHVYKPKPAPEDRAA